MPDAGLSIFSPEAMYQKYRTLHPYEAVSSPHELAYHFRNTISIVHSLLIAPGGKEDYYLSGSFQGAWEQRLARIPHPD